MKKSHRSVVRRSITPENMGRPLSPPLASSVMYHYENVSQMQSLHDNEIEGFTYARDGHPNGAALADKLSWMEGAKVGVMTASGMSAITAAFLSVLRKGDSIAAASQLYGRSLKLVSDELPRLGFETRFFDASDPATFADSITPDTRIVLAEIVSNPMLRVTQFEALAAAAKKADALLLVDNTFTTPNGFNPLAHGADLVMHSVTKMLSGHSDLNLGYLGGNDPELMAGIDDVIATMGFNASPYSCWLAERGLNTFDLRFRQAQENAKKLADLLEKHPMVGKVHFPGLESHSDHALAKKLLPKGFGTMVSFVLKGDRTQADAFLTAAENIPYGPTLGDVATIVVMPAFSSHRKLPREERLAIGIEDNLIRVSLGIEDFELIERDFSDALDQAALTLGAVDVQDSQPG
ncbi:MAG: cystathionine gamma-synthase [Alphaproteobacteria bacterium]|nr:cystathionine gamma-synthase [Alphaproteobacteria bacterium]